MLNQIRFVAGLFLLPLLFIFSFIFIGTFQFSEILNQIRFAAGISFEHVGFLRFFIRSAPTVGTFYKPGFPFTFSRSSRIK
ncbi:hypothetical protein HRI_000131400 [Hibiscus trionum]|uniref:Uncharacterized protein n=1 Tax=Hibiscus trionum TaxID=183268 RepID=A0A9W7GTI9_HIBTR|nr:hypothetical protein HRI_000131400 [Hibiscus trionum]